MKTNRILYITLVFVLSFSIMASAQTPVQTSRSVRENITITELLSGKVVPEKIIDLPAEINGVVSKIYVSVGDHVKTGDRLLSFDKRQLSIQKEQSQAALEAAQANLRQIEKGASNEDIKTAEANYEQAELSLESAKKGLELVKEIFGDKTSLKQQLINSELQYKNAQKQLQSAEDRINQAKKALEQAEVGVRQAELNLNQAKVDYERMGNLFEDNVISKKELEGAKMQLDNAQASYDNAVLQVENAELSVESARTAKQQAEISVDSSEQIYELAQETFNNPTQLRQQLQSAESQVDISAVNLKIAKANLDRVKKGADEDQIKATRANVKQAEAGLEQTELQLSKADIKSPVNAQIASINTEENEMVGLGTPVIKLAVIERLNVETSITPELRPYVNKGDKVEIRTNNNSYEGIIKTISPLVSPQTEAYPITVEFVNSTDNVYPGMFVDIRINKESTNNAVTVPIDAVVSLESSPYLYIVKDNKAVRKDVEVGIVYGNQVEIVSGITEDDIVITRGQNNITDGQSVEVVE
ncbi:MAG: efflux RND transporter periplasmic adaptor subunit [Halanaerobiales bacterium]|nr:efflux RND transporter periplasmic adaptor subunit [Halanaerobiales bacterium]